MSNSKNQLVTDFNIDDFIVKPVKSFKTKKGIQMTRSDCKYAHKNGEGIVLIRGPKSFCPMGFSPQWEMNLAEEKRNDSNISNWSTLISLHNHEDEETDPKKLEEGRKFSEMCTQMVEKGYETIMKPENFSLIDGSPKIMLKSGIEGFKLIVSPSNIIDDKKNAGKKKKIGPSMNAKLMWDKDTNTFQTKVRGPTGWVNPTTFRNVPGEIEPVFLVDNIFIGGHGKAAYGASYQVRLWMCNYYPAEKGGPKPTEDDADDLLPQHTAPAVEKKKTYDSDGPCDDGEDGDIDLPSAEVDVSNALEDISISPPEEEEEDVEVEEVKPKKPVKKPVKRRVKA